MAQKLEKLRNRKQIKCLQAILILPSNSNKIEKIKHLYISKHYSDYENKVILFMAADVENDIILLWKTYLDYYITALWC